MGSQASYGAAGIQGYIRQQMLDRIAEEERQRRVRQVDQELALRGRALDSAEADRAAERQNRLEIAGLGAQDRAEGRILGEADRITRNTEPLASLSKPSAGVLRLVNPELVKTNPEMAFPPSLETPEARDVNPGAQPGDVFTGTQPQLRQMRVDEATAARQQQAAVHTQAQDERAQRMEDLANRREDRLSNQGTASSTGRSDRSYQYNNNLLEKKRLPLQQQEDRMGRLAESLNQRTPQADALIAPELLTAMAGGMGSGLRMNEAEIARIVGGRSVWENLRATLNKVATDPKKALSIPDAQRAQMQSLLEAVRGRVGKKLNVINETGQSLTEADDVQAHRKLMNDLDRRLREIDEGRDMTTVKSIRIDPSYQPPK